jgi:hypothetical protein
MHENNILCSDVVVDKNHYYIDGELEELKKYVMQYKLREKEQKISKVLNKLNQLKFR